jgi:hypothetical protein
VSLALLSRCAAVALVVLAGSARPSLARPDFSGLWTLDVPNSRLGKMTGITPPSARTDSILHTGVRLRDVVTQTKSGTRSTSTYEYQLDGADRVMKVGGQDAHYRGTWRGDTLLLDSQLRVTMFEIVVRERWVLSRERRALTIVRRLRYPLGDGEQTLRFVRQPSGAGRAAR